jgi:hypothetical protein
MKDKIPLGLLVLGAVNAFFFGLLAFVFSLIAYFGSTFEFIQKTLELIKEKNPAFDSVTPEMLKLVFLGQALIALIFLISGAGIVLRKEWARKLTIYFAFFLLLLVFLSALANPSLLTQMLLNVIYPAILIFYFTNRKLDKYFS